MYCLSVSNLQPDQVLAKAVYSDRGTAWLKAGTVLNERYIELLRSKGVGNVFIEDQATADIVVHDLITPELRAQVTSEVGNEFAAGDTVAAKLRGAPPLKILEWMATREGRRSIATEFPVIETHEMATSMVDEILMAPSSSALTTLKTLDSYTVTHCVDTAAVAVAIGKRLNVSRRDLIRLARGCLLHDIGLIFIDQELLNKTELLTAAELKALAHHTVFGFELLKQLQPDDIVPNHITLQHHERQDGHGYPRGLRGTNHFHCGLADRDRGAIMALAEIAAVADVYDALSSNRPYRPALPPEDVVAVLGRVAGTQLNKEIVDAFLSMLPVFPLGSVVQITTTRYRYCRALVARINRDDLARPIIRVISDPLGRPLPPVDIDLRQNAALQISTMAVGHGSADLEMEMAARLVPV